MTQEGTLYLVRRKKSGAKEQRFQEVTLGFEGGKHPTS